MRRARGGRPTAAARPRAPGGPVSAARAGRARRWGGGGRGGRAWRRKHARAWAVMHAGSAAAPVAGWTYRLLMFDLAPVHGGVVSCTLEPPPPSPDTRRVQR